MQVEYDQVQSFVQPLLERCRALQEQCGSASEAFPLTKELRGVQKQNGNVGAQLKKLCAGISDTLNKRFNERLSYIQRSTSNAQEKLNWSLAEPSADRFSIEAKLDAILGVETALDDVQCKVDDVQSVAKAVASICDEPAARKKVEQSVTEAQEKLHKLRQDCEDQKKSVDYSHVLLHRFELASENASSWLRDVESQIRNESVSQVALNQLTSKIALIQELDADIESHQVDIDEVKELATQVISFHFLISFIFFIFFFKEFVLFHSFHSFTIQFDSLFLLH